MRTFEIDYVVWREEKYFVSKCLNVEVSSFGETAEDAIKNLKEAVELYFEGEEKDFVQISNIVLGREIINA